MSQTRNLMFHHDGGDIPSNYIVADCIQIPTTGYIVTGIPATPRRTRSLFKVKWQGSSTGTRGLFGVRTSASANTQSYNVFLTVGSSGPRWDNTGGANMGVSNWSVGETHEVELTQTPDMYGQAIVDGVIQATGTQVMSGGTYSSIYINTHYTTGTGAIATGGTMRWYYCKIWQDGETLSGDFVPVFDRTTSQAGFYDKVTQSFFGNDGSADINAYDAEGNLITG